jgi:hypothetical protein
VSQHDAKNCSLHAQNTQQFFWTTGKSEFGVSSSSVHKIFPYRFRMPEWREKVPATHTQPILRVFRITVGLECGVI